MGCLHGRGGTKCQLAFVSGKGKKGFTEQLGQNRWEPVELLALVPSLQQWKQVDFCVLSLASSTFPKISGLSECLPGLLQVSVIV